MDGEAPQGLTVLVVADAVERFDPVRETTSHIVRALRARQIETFLAEPGGIHAVAGVVTARARRVASLSAAPFAYTLDEPRCRPVADFGLVFLRHDPPVDDRFRAPLELLALVADRVRCINDPRTLLQWSEKILAMRWPALTPPTWVVSGVDDALEAVRACGTAIVKPLHRCGGSGVFLLRTGDSNAAPILEECFRSEPRLIVQEYLPGVREGDARILTVGDRILGAFLRIPAPGSHRSNLHCHGRLARWHVSGEVAGRLQPVLRTLADEGIAFAGLDWIDGRLIEINITSPMGLGELDATGFVDGREQTAAAVLVSHCLAGVATDGSCAPAYS